MTRMDQCSRKRQTQAQANPRRRQLNENGCAFSSTRPSRWAPRCFFLSLLLWSRSSRCSCWKHRKDACSVRWHGRRLWPWASRLCWQSLLSPSSWSFSFAEAAARIGQSDFKNYAGTLFAGFKTLPEIPQNDVAVESGIPSGDVSLDVQDGQSIYASLV